MFSFIFKIVFFIYTAVSEDRNANEDFLVWGGLRVESGEPISNTKLCGLATQKSLFNLI